MKQTRLLRNGLLSGAVACLSALALGGAALASVPYPQSTVLCNITWDNLYQTGYASSIPDGSDLWPVAWATDPNGQDVIYTAWGDGGGFGYASTSQKVSSGIGVITGSPPFSNSNVCGSLLNVNGAYSADPSCFASYHSTSPSWPSNGKVANLISAGGTLYSVVNTQDTNGDLTLEWSTDHGVTWQKASWSFPKSALPTSFILYGKDNANAPSGYIYGIATDYVNAGPNGVGSRNILFRVLPSQIETYADWQWFTGTTSAPAWTANAASSATTVFTELNNGIDISYLPSVNGGRYLLANSHGLTSTTTGGAGTLGVYDAPEPYGPWTTVAYYTNWLGGSTNPEALNFTFVPKFTSSLSSWMVFSTYVDSPNTPDLYHDRFNILHASLVTSGSAACPGGPAGNILSGNNTLTPPATVDNSDFNTISASPVVVGSSAVSVTSISVWVNNVDASPNNKFQVAIYKDSSGVPVALIASTASQTLTAQSWNTIPITASLNANTKYWLAYNTNGLHGSSNDMSYSTGSSPNARWYSNTSVTFGTWPSTAPAGSQSANQQYYLYATYSGSGGGGGTLGSQTATPPATVDNSDFNTMSGSQITVGSSAITATSMSVWVNSVDASPTNKYQVAIYTDNSGVPGSLVTSTSSQTLTANSWNTVSLSANLAANTKYWLLYNTDGLHGTSNDMSYNSSGSRWFSNASVTFGSWPSTAPAGSTATGTYSIYVSY